MAALIAVTIRNRDRLLPPRAWEHALRSDSAPEPRAQDERLRARARPRRRSARATAGARRGSAGSSGRRGSAPRCTSSATASGRFPYHFHHGMEEWLLVVDGTPTLRTPDGERELRRGDVVCFPPGPDGAHQVRGPGHGADPLGEPARRRRSSTPTAASSARGRRGRSSASPTRSTTGTASERRARQPVRARGRGRRDRPGRVPRADGPLRPGDRRGAARRLGVRARPGRERVPVPLRVPRGGVAARARGPADAARPGRRARARAGRPRPLPGGPGRRAQGDEPRRGASSGS